MISINADKFLKNIEQNEMKYGEHLLPVVFNTSKSHEFDLVFV